MAQTPQAQPASPDGPDPEASFSLLQPATAGILTALVGFGSTFAVVIQGLAAVGATPAEAASGLMMMCFAMAVLSILFSLRLKMPVSVAWSTPGAALFASTGMVAGGFPAAVGAFIATGVIIVVAGMWKPLGRLAAAIPPSIANAMLAGVLLKLCLAPFAAVAIEPGLALAVIGVFLVVGRFARLYAVPAALVAALVLLFAGSFMGHGGGTFDPAALALPRPALVMPVFTPEALIGIAIPLFLVTMASQNIPGLAVLSAFGYRPEAGPLFRGTGLISILIAPFGGMTINLAAITAAIAAGPDAAADPARRYIAAAIAGACYFVLGLLAFVAATGFGASPPLLIQVVAGLALIGSFGSAMLAGLKDEADRPAALVTFLFTASGLSIAGIGPAFWGLAGGIAVLMLHGRLKRGHG